MWTILDYELKEKAYRMQLEVRRDIFGSVPFEEIMKNAHLRAAMGW